MTYDRQSQVGLFEGLSQLSPVPGEMHGPEEKEHRAILDFVDEPVPQVELAHTRKRKQRVLTLDESIEVASTVLRGWQESYLPSMKKLKHKNPSRTDRAIWNCNGQLFTWCFRGEVLHPGLKRSFCRAPAQEVHPNADSQLEVTANHNLLDLEPDFGRQLLPATEELELGRRDIVNDEDRLSTRDSLLPWNFSREGSILRSVSDARVSNASAQETPRSFSFMQTPILRSRQSSLRPSNRGSTNFGPGALERVDSQGRLDLSHSCRRLTPFQTLKVKTRQ